MPCRVRETDWNSYWTVCWMPPFIYPTNGDKVLQLAMDILEKKPLSRETVMNTAVVDRTNAHIMQFQTTHISELDKRLKH